MLNIAPDQLEIVKRILADHVPGMEVRGYDSRVYWVREDYLDLGLIVIGEKALDLGTLNDLEDAFSAAMDEDLTINVEVLDWHKIHYPPLPPEGQNYGFERIKAFRESLDENFEVIQQAELP